MGRLEGRVALVTGAGRGIGLATALKLAREGASVVVNDLDAQAVLDAVATVRAGGGDATGLAMSVTEDGFGDRAVGCALDAFGRLDIVVNNAGYTWDGVIQGMGDDQWEAMLAVHATAPFRILRAFIRHVRELPPEARGGRHVVNVTSVAGTRGGAGQANYSAAKAAVTGLTLALAREWGRYGITVNAVSFGMIDTRLTDVTSTLRMAGTEIRVGMPQAVREAVLARIPLGREGTCEEAAGAIALLCFPEASYITGQVLEVSGGLAF
jgi:3-oxoacyl-[acyl-carrier protein] reductase